MTSLFDPHHVLVGANPIIWSNDDFPDLNGDMPLDAILNEMRSAGYAGTELGHAYPRAAHRLAEALGRHDLRLVSGWHSTYFAEESSQSEFKRLGEHLRLLKTLGARVAIVAECTLSIHGDTSKALGFGNDDRSTLSEEQWERLVVGLNLACQLAAQQEMRLAYHHHMGTVIQTEAELDRVLASVPSLSLVFDPGHLSFAGIDPLAILARHGPRISHCHLKSVRSEVVMRARQEAWSFYRAVKEGVFAAPGQGHVPFPAIFEKLSQLHYRGWLVVEAEEDPDRVAPSPKAVLARAYVRELTGI